MQMTGIFAFRLELKSTTIVSVQKQKHFELFAFVGGAVIQLKGLASFFLPTSLSSTSLTLLYFAFLLLLYHCVRAFLYLIHRLLCFICINESHLVPISLHRVHHLNGSAQRLLLLLLLLLRRHIYIYMAMRGKICCKLFTVIAINKMNLCFQPLLNQQQQQQ